MDFKGDCDTEVVLTGGKHWLIPEREPGDTVIWDNTKPQALRGLESSRNRPVIASSLLTRFKPPREADRRSFEPFWRWLKAWIRQLNQPNLHISQALTEVFKTIPG